ALGGLAALRARHLADLLAVGGGRALLDPGSLLERRRGGRGLADEGERPVLEDRPFARRDHPRLALGARVELLDELHDVDTMGAERGPHRRRRRRLPGGNLEFHYCSNRLGHPVPLNEPSTASSRARPRSASRTGIRRRGPSPCRAAPLPPFRRSPRTAPR